MQEERRPLVNYWGFLVLALSVIAFKYFIVNRMPTPFRRARLQADGTVPGIEHPVHRSYADGLELIGHSQNPDQMPADGILRVDLYWTVRQQPSRRYQTVVHLVGPNGFRWSRQDSFRPRDYQGSPPTYSWTPGRYAVDSHEIEPLSGVPPGRYDVVLTVFDRETLAPLSVLNEQGQPTAPERTLNQVTLTAPRVPADPSDLGIRHRFDASLGSVTLLGADFDRDEAVPGDPVWVTTFWHVDEQLDEDLTLRLELVAPQGSPVAEYARSPVAPWHPTSAWRPGDVWRGQQLLYLPADLDTATYTWSLSLFPPSASLVTLSKLSVTAPNRTFTSPTVDIETDTRLGDVATLVGASVKPRISALSAGSTLTVTLVWRAEVETDTSYHVFVHLVGPDGRLMAQSDSVPANWTRPTTGWLAGEYVTDEHELTLPEDAPSGDYQLYAGLYAPDGRRLLTPEGADTIRVTTMTVER